MSKKWQTKKLGDFLTLEYGKPLDKALRKQNGKYPAYGANGVKAWSDELYYDKKTIIIGRKGSAGEITLTEGKFWPLDVTYFVKFDEEKYDLYFIYYMLSCLSLPSLATGVKPGINRNTVYSIEVNVPPIQEQKRIVAILDQAFADVEKIRANTEKNLKNARELFESYLQQTFTHAKDCITSPVKDISVKIGSGATPLGGKSSYQDEGISLIRSMNVYDRKFKEVNLAFINEEQAAKLNNVNIEINDILLNITGASVARCCVVPNKILPARVNQHVSIIRVKEDIILPNLLSYILTSKPYKDKLLKISGSGSTREAITKSQIGEFIVSFPKALKSQIKLSDEIKLFEQEISNLERIYTNKLDALDHLKKSLLHQAFIGQLTKQEVTA